MIATTRDSISLRGAGVVAIAQPKKGFRFTLDSLLLADFCRIKPRDHILEPGSGSGIVSILLAKKYPRITLTAIEKLHDAAVLCEQNILLNDVRDRITMIEQDLAKAPVTLPPASFDVIVANPPYVRTGTGRTSTSPARQSARHDRNASLPAWLDLCSLLKNRGRYILVFPANRSGELLSRLSEKKLEPKLVRFVHPYANKSASLILVEAVKAGGIGLEVLPPLIVHEQGGGYTAEMKEIYGMT